MSHGSTAVATGTATAVIPTFRPSPRNDAVRHVSGRRRRCGLRKPAVAETTMIRGIRVVGQHPPRQLRPLRLRGSCRPSWRPSGDRGRRASLSVVKGAQRYESGCRPRPPPSIGRGRTPARRPLRLGLHPLEPCGGTSVAAMLAETSSTNTMLRRAASTARPERLRQGRDQQQTTAPAWPATARTAG